MGWKTGVMVYLSDLLARVGEAAAPILATGMKELLIRRPLSDYKIYTIFSEPGKEGRRKQFAAWFLLLVV